MAPIHNNAVSGIIRSGQRRQTGFEIGSSFENGHPRFVPHPAGPMFGAMNQYGFDALTR